jgi:hypothetical protein
VGKNPWILDLDVDKILKKQIKQISDELRKTWLKQQNKSQHFKSISPEAKQLLNDQTCISSPDEEVTMCSAEGLLPIDVQIDTQQAELGAFRNMLLSVNSDLCSTSCF